MKSTISIRMAVVAVLGSALGGAQTAHVYHHTPPIGEITNTVVCHDACKVPVPQETVAAGYTTFALSGAPNFAPLGGHALDQERNKEYVSDGTHIAIHQIHPLYDGSRLCTTGNLCFPFGPGPMGPFTYPTPAVFLGGRPFGTITGMAVRQANTICPPALYVTDGAYIMGLQLCPDTPGGWTAASIVELPFPGPPTVGGVPLSGLEIDISGVIVACDVNGWSYYLSSACSTIVLPPGLSSIPPPAGVIPGTIIGNVYDRSIGATSLYVTDGLVLFRVFSPCLNNVVISPLVVGRISRGASFSAEPIVLQACDDYSPLVIGTSEPIVAGKTNVFITLDAPVTMANVPAALVYGPCTTTPFLADCSGCFLRIDLLNYGVVFDFTDAAGDICYPVSIPNAPLTIYLQWAVLDFLSCPLPPHATFSDALHCRVSDA